PLQNRQDVARGILEPRDRWAVLAMDSTVILGDSFVPLELDPRRSQSVNRLIDILHREVQHRERGRLMFGFRVDQDLSATGQGQGEHAVLLGHLEPKRSGIELPRFRYVVRREPASGVAVSEHRIPPDYEPI